MSLQFEVLGLEVWVFVRSRHFVAPQRQRINVHNCEAQGNGRAKGRLRKSIVDCQLSIVDIDFPEALH